MRNKKLLPLLSFILPFSMAIISCNSFDSLIDSDESEKSNDDSRQNEQNDDAKDDDKKQDPVVDPDEDHKEDEPKQDDPKDDPGEDDPGHDNQDDGMWSLDFKQYGVSFRDTLAAEIIKKSQRNDYIQKLFKFRTKRSKNWHKIYSILSREWLYSWYYS